MPLMMQKLQNSLQVLARKLSIADEDADREQIPTKEFHQLIPVLNVAYYFCVSPFRIRKGEDGKYKIHTQLLQKVLTVVFNLLVVSYMIRAMAIDYPSDSVIKDPKSLFKILKSILQLFVIISSFHILWQKSNVLGDLLKISQQNENEQKKAKTVSIRLLVFLWIFAPFTMDIYRYRNTLRNFDFGKIIQKSKFNNQTFCTTFNLMQNCSIPGAFYEWPTAIQILGGGNKLFICYIWILEALVGSVILSSAFVIYQSSKGFYRRISKNPTDITKIYMHYRHVGRVTESINSFVGPLFIVYIIKIFCEHINDIFEVLVLDNPNIHLYGRIFYLVVLLQAVVVLLVCAEANRQMNCLKDWITLYKIKELNDMELSEDINPESHKIFKLLKMQAGERNIGLGVGSLFTVTYTFLATLLGVFATYAIIQLQFHSENERENQKQIIHITLQLNKSVTAIIANDDYKVHVNTTE